MNVDRLIEKTRSLGVGGWGLYAHAAGVEEAAGELSEGLAQSMHMPDASSAWKHMDMFLQEHQVVGAMDSEPRAVVQRFFDRVGWSTPRPRHISDCYVVVVGNASHADDEGVAGVYTLKLGPEGLRLALESGEGGATQHAIAKAVKDSFHDHIGIKVLDDFEITIQLPDGTSLEEDDGVGSGSVVLDADFCGQCDLEGVALPVRRFYATSVAGADRFPVEGRR